MKRNVRTAYALLLATAGGCTSPFRAEVADVDPARWTAPVCLTLDNADTTSLCDLDLFLRLDDRFAEDTLTVRIGIRTPDSLRYEEPFVMTFAPRRPGSAALAEEAVVAYRRSVRFARSGDYRLTVSPCRPVRGVEAVGIRTGRSR